MPRLSDIALIAQVVTFGSERAFAQLVRAHQEAVRRFLVRLTGGDQMLADDLAQEAFIRAWQGLKSFRGGSSFETWLMKIAYRTFLDERRKNPSDTSTIELEAKLTDDGIQSPGTTPSPSDSRWALKHDLDLALATLNDNERTCIILQCVEGMGIKDIATITGLNENTIKSHLLRGKKNLANYLRKNGYNG
ncbi:MAG: RNA polymerase sigma factor [Bacteroidales bacterium]|nr:RNA polymerase sigma factor [Bacteroidales bacterium]